MHQYRRCTAGTKGQITRAGFMHRANKTLWLHGTVHVTAITPVALIKPTFIVEHGLCVCDILIKAKEYKQ